MTEATFEQQSQTPHQTEVAKSPGNAAAAKPHPLLSVLLLFAVSFGSGSLALERKLIFTSLLQTAAIEQLWLLPLSLVAAVCTWVGL